MEEKTTICVCVLFLSEKICSLSQVYIWLRSLYFLVRVSDMLIYTRESYEFVYRFGQTIYTAVVIPFLIFLGV